MKTFFKSFSDKIKNKTKKLLLGITLVTSLSGCGAFQNLQKSSLNNDAKKIPDTEVLAAKAKIQSKYQNTDDILNDIAVKLLIDIHHGNRDYHTAKSEIDNMVSILEDKAKNGDIELANSSCCKELKGYETSSIGALVGILSEWKLHKYDNPELIKFLTDVTTDRDFKAKQIKETQGLYISIYDHEDVAPEKIIKDAMRSNPLPEYCDAIMGETTGLLYQADKYKERLTAAFSEDKQTQNRTADFTQERKNLAIQSAPSTAKQNISSRAESRSYQKIWNKFYDNAVEMIVSEKKKSQIYHQIDKQLKNNIFTLPSNISKEKLAYSYILYSEYGLKSSIKNALSSKTKLSKQQLNALVADVYAVGDKGEGLKTLAQQTHNNHLSTFSRYDNAPQSLKNKHITSLSQIKKMQGKEIKTLKELLQLKKQANRNS